MRPFTQHRTSLGSARVIDGSLTTARIGVCTHWQRSHAVNDEFEDVQRFFESERRTARWLLAACVLASGLIVAVAFAGGAIV